LENTLLSEEDMLQEHRIVHTVLRRYFRPSTVVAVVSALLLVGHAAWTGHSQGGSKGVDDRGAVRLLKTVPIPGTNANTTNGKLYSFDISFVNDRVI
jgi:hypothetical protein